MFKENLFQILKELNKYKRDKEYLELYYVQNRLDKTLERYYQQLIKTVDTLYDKVKIRDVEE